MSNWMSSQTFEEQVIRGKLALLKKRGLRLLTGEEYETIFRLSGMRPKVIWRPATFSERFSDSLCYFNGLWHALRRRSGSVAPTSSTEYFIRKELLTLNVAAALDSRDYYDDFAFAQYQQCMFCGGVKCDCGSTLEHLCSLNDDSTTTTVLSDMPCSPQRRRQLKSLQRQ